MKCLIDSGADQSFVSERIRNKLKLESEEIPHEELISINSELIYTNKTVIEKIRIPAIRKAPYLLTFKVLDNLCDDIVLGADFLTKFQLLVDTANRRVFQQQENYLPEETIAQKTDVVGIRDGPSQAATEPEQLEIPTTSKEEKWQNEIKKLVEKEREEIHPLGKLGSVEHEIELVNWQPAKVKDYYIPYERRPQVQAELEKLRSLGIIQESKSKYLSPAFPVPKKDGSIRLVVDYRNLNKFTQKNHFPIPDLQESLHSLGGNRLFSSLDLNMGYYQIPVRKEHRRYTGFVVNGQQYEFCRMPFGLCNAPATFQSTMNTVLKGIPNCRVYLDDILIYSRSYKEHLRDLKEVFRCLREAGAAINFTKSRFAEKEISFLGNVINEEGRRPDLSRVETYNFTVPKNKKQLQSFLGFINWFRPYIMNMSERVAKLTDKLSSERLKWDEADTRIALEILDDIKTNTLLSHPDYSLDFEMECDASNRAIGCILKQGENIIGFYSKKLSTSEEKYNIVEKELYSIIRGLQFFRKIIYNRNVKITTDNKNIAFQKMNGSKHYERWFNILEEYHYSIEHRPGFSNVAADHLSRINSIRHTNHLYYDLQKIEEAQKQEADENNPELSQDQRTINIKGHNIRVDTLNRVVVPSSLQKEFVANLHLFLGHPGAYKLQKTISKYYTGKLPPKTVFQHTRNCELCQKNKTPTKIYGKSTGQALGEAPFSVICSNSLDHSQLKNLNNH